MKLTIEIDSTVDGEDSLLAHYQAMDMFLAITSFTEDLRLKVKHQDENIGCLMCLESIYDMWWENLKAYNISLEP